MPISRWRYDIVTTGAAGCLVEESTWDRRPAWIVPFANLVTGVRSRTERNRRNIEASLRQLKHTAERTGDRGTPTA